MARRFSYIVVEGPHDVEFVGRVLRKGPHSFHYIERKSLVDEYWHPLIPNNYPVGKPPKDFLHRVPMPTFYQNDTHSVAIQSANGINKIVSRLEETLAVPEFVLPDSIGIILDSDSTETPMVRAAKLAGEVVQSAQNLKSAWPQMPGVVVSDVLTKLRSGQFILPDNSAQGTLEDILIAVGNAAYPTLIPLAQAHVQAAQRSLVVGTSGWTSQDNDELKAPAGPKKATIASATAILKPGKTCQVSLSDNRWIEAATLGMSPLKEFADWLHTLIL
jgi:hypothetical protein